MPSTYVPDADHNPANITVPVDGDSESAASVQSPLEDLADKSAYTQKHYPLDTVYTIGRTQPYNLTPVTVNVESIIATEWGMGPGSVWTQFDTTATVALGIDHALELPNASQLIKVSVFLNGKTFTGHASLPASMPQIRVFKINIGTGVSTPISTLVTDGSADVAAYDVAHEVFATVAETVDRVNYRYHARIIGESGANSVAGLNILGAQAVYQVAALDKGAA